MIPTYCTQNNGDCEICSLVNYMRDCMNNPISENRTGKRLSAVMDHAARITADMADEKAGRIKKKAIQINFNEAELDRLKAKADAQCLRLQDYIRKILSAYG